MRVLCESTFRGYFKNIPKTYERPPQMLSTGLDRCLLYASRMPPLGLTPGNRLRRRPARPRERRLRGPRGLENDLQLARTRRGPPQVPPRCGRGRRRACGWPRRRQGSCATSSIPGRARADQAWQKRVLDAFPVGRGARGAYRRAPRGAPDPRRAARTVFGGESGNCGRCCSPSSPGGNLLAFPSRLLPYRLSAPSSRVVAPGSVPGPVGLETA